MVILTQTDTTVGFISQDFQALQDIKQRESSKPFIKVYKDFKTLQSSKHRVPNNFKNRVRRSNKTSFIIKNRAFRVAESSLNSQLLRANNWNYSTSANEKGKDFDEEFCTKSSNAIIESSNGLKQLHSSQLFKLNSIIILRVR